MVCKSKKTWEEVISIWDIEGCDKCGNSRLNLDYKGLSVKVKDGNIFSILAEADSVLRKAGIGFLGEEMVALVSISGDYDDALSIIGNYVTLK